MSISSRKVVENYVWRDWEIYIIFGRTRKLLWRSKSTGGSLWFRNPLLGPPLLRCLVIRMPPPSVITQNMLLNNILPELTGLILQSQWYSDYNKLSDFARMCLAFIGPVASRSTLNVKRKSFNIPLISASHFMIDAGMDRRSRKGSGRIWLFK